MPTTTTVYTKVRNTSGVDMFFAFLGPRGAFLTAGSDYKVAGRIDDLWQKNQLMLDAYQNALEAGRIEVLKTPDAYLFDAGATRVRKLTVNNGTVGVADPDYGSYTGSAYGLTSLGLTIESPRGPGGNAGPFLVPGGPVTNFERRPADPARLQLRDPGPGEPSLAVLGPGLHRVYRLAKALCRGRGLDVGAAYYSGSSAHGFPGATPVDLTIPGSGTATDLSRYAAGAYDYVIHSHTLEHVADPERALREARRVLRPGGVLFLYLPYPGHPEWDPTLNPGVRHVHLWQPDPTAVGRMLLLAGFRVAYAEWAADEAHGFLTVAAAEGPAP